MEEIRIGLGNIMFHTTFCYEKYAMNCRIKGPCDQISRKIPIERSHDFLLRQIDRPAYHSRMITKLSDDITG